MNASGFSWFPPLGGEERALVFIDAKLGHLVNLDGSSPGDPSKEGFCRSFASRADALQWANAHRPTREVICLLYDKEKREEFVPLIDCALGNHSMKEPIQSPQTMSGASLIVSELRCSVKKMKFPVETTICSKQKHEAFADALRRALTERKLEPFTLSANSTGLEVEVPSVRRRRAGWRLRIKIKEEGEGLLIRYSVLPVWLELFAHAFVVALCVLAGLTDGFQFSGVVWRWPLYAALVIFALMAGDNLYSHVRHPDIDRLIESAMQVEKPNQSSDPMPLKRHGSA